MLDAEVRPVADGVLGDEHDLLRPLPDEIDDLLQHVQRPLAHLPPLDAGDGAEGAGVIAAVGDLDVGRGSGLGPAEGGQHPLAAGDLRLRRLAQQAADHVADAMPLPRRQHVVDAAGDVIAVVAEGGHAAGGDDDLIVAAAVEQLGDGRHRLIARRAEEAAGIDDHHPRVLGTLGGGHAARAEEMIHPVGIDPVLRAAEGQDVKRAIGIVCRGLNHD